MGPTRKRDLTATVVLVAVTGYLLTVMIYPKWFPPITVWTGISLLAVAAVEAAWGRYVRSKIDDGQIGDGSDRLHPLAVARTVVIAKASAWVGALVLGWWLGVLAYLLPQPRLAAGGRPGHPRRGRRRAQRAGADRRGSVATALLRKTGGPT